MKIPMQNGQVFDESLPTRQIDRFKFIGLGAIGDDLRILLGCGGQRQGDCRCENSGYAPRADAGI